MRASAAVVQVLLLWAALSGLAAAQPQEYPSAPHSLSLTAYASRLEQISSALETGDTDSAHALARDLAAARIAWVDETIGPDVTLLAAIEAAEGRHAPRLARRVSQLVHHLRDAEATPLKPDTARPEILARLAGDDIDKGGDVTPPRVRPITLPERLDHFLGTLAGGLGGLLRLLLDWIRRLFAPRPPATEGDAGATTVVTLIVVAAASLGLVLLALAAWRRSHRVEPQFEAASAEASARDDDPLSRDASEWERYAGELAAAGRRREAIRALYHAVLVLLFRSGLVHHRRGRTNWEYATQLAPELPWRPLFFDMTRVFEREWYGRSASDADALRSYRQRGHAILRALRSEEGTP